MSNEPLYCVAVKNGYGEICICPDGNYKPKTWTLAEARYQYEQLTLMYGITNVWIFRYVDTQTTVTVKIDDSDD